MFYSISWQSYWVAIALLTALYYLIICLFYYRSHFYAWIQHLHGRRPKVPSSTSVPFLQEPEPTGEIRQSSLFEEASNAVESEPAGSDTSITNGFTDELDAFLRQAKQQRLVKQEVLYGVQRLLQKDDAFKNAANKERLLYLLSERCNQIGSIHLSVEDLEGIGTGKGE